MHKSSQLVGYHALSSDSFCDNSMVARQVGAWTDGFYSIQLEFFPKENTVSGKSLGMSLVHCWSSRVSREYPKPPSNKMSRSFSPSGKPLVKTSRGAVINTEEPAITVDVGGTVKTVRGVNVTINCQVAGEKCIHMLIHLFKY